MIREMQASDFPSLKTIGMTCFETIIDPQHKYWMVHLMMKRYLRKKRFIARKKEGVLIKGLEVEGLIVGFYELEKTGFLSSLYVLPTKQHLGYGKALLLDACKEARSQKQTTLKLESSEVAEGFYRKLGFKRYQNPKKVLKIPMIPMIKQL